MVRWFAQTSTGASPLAHRLRYSRRAAAMPSTRHPSPKRISATVAGTHTTDSRRPRARCTARPSRSRGPSRLASTAASLGELGRDQLHGVAHRVHGVHVVIRDLDAELVLERQHDVHEARRVHLEIVQDMRRRRHMRQRLAVLHVWREYADYLGHDFGLAHLALLPIRAPTSRAPRTR